MKKLVSALFVLGLFCGFVMTVQAEKPEQEKLWEVIPGECFLDFEVSPQAIAIDDMNGSEVQLEANWTPAEQGEGTKYGGDAKFAVLDVKIGEADPEGALTVDIGLTLDEPELSEAESDNLFIYSCDGVDPVCTATLVNVKAAITKKIAQANEVEVGNVSYASKEGATFLGIFVKGMDPPGSRTGKGKKQNYKLTEICNMYVIPLAEASTNE